MGKRIHEIAKITGKDTNFVLHAAKELGLHYYASKAKSKIDPSTADYIINHIRDNTYDQISEEEKQSNIEAYKPKPRLKPKPKPSAPPIKATPSNSITPKKANVVAINIDAPYMSRIIEKLIAANPRIILLNEYFDWPHTNAKLSSKNNSLLNNLPQTGVLSEIGYTVGAKSLPENERHKILTYTYLSDKIPMVLDIAHMNTWGKANTAKRLKKIANCLAEFCKSAKRKKSADMRLSIQHWENDLQWLKENIYEPSNYDKAILKWPLT